MLLSKPKKERQIQPLHDQSDNNLLSIFLTNIGDSYRRKKELIRVQLRITYIIRDHCGLRIN